VTLKLGLGSIKVIGTDTDRSDTFDFLLTFHSNHGPISHRFRDKRRFQTKIAHFPHPTCIFAPLTGFPLELGVGAMGQKNKSDGSILRERRLTLSSAIWIQSTNVTDGRTDGHRATARAVLTHSIAWVTRNSAVADKPRDAFTGQSRSPNMVPFHMLGMVSY